MTRRMIYPNWEYLKSTARDVDVTVTFGNRGTHTFTVTPLKLPPDDAYIAYGVPPGEDEASREEQRN